MKNIPHAQWTRIENRHGGGVPDLYGIYGGQAIWLELKCIKQNSISLSPLQISCPRYEIKGYQIIQR
jgi:hypothetical protein